MLTRNRSCTYVNMGFAETNANIHFFLHSCKKKSLFFSIQKNCLFLHM